MIKAGILGGGQLGRMMLQEAANYPVETWVMENDEHCPAAHLCNHFVKGDIRNFDVVLAFGRQLDCLTIEIEHVNVEALEQLEEEGLRIYPKPSALRIIQDKILQKQFYTAHDIPTAPYHIVEGNSQIHQHFNFLPAVQKLGKGGYDGRGVQMIRQQEDIKLGFDAPSVLEKMIRVKKELALMVALNEKGEAAIYPPVEMVFDPVLNLLDYQLCPANLPEKTFWKAEAIALSVARNLKSPGLFAIELLLDLDDNIFVNETAPRVHNSGHHTIEAHYSSQFDMLWRIMLSYPLGNTDPILPSVMLNLLGEDGYQGDAVYEGLEQALAVDNCFVHIYGKKESKSGRKMGHVTVMSKEKADLLLQAKKIRQHLKVKGIQKTNA
jgi:5-(carboxyamino)imidazole ribonucleotide synthase